MATKIPNVGDRFKIIANGWESWLDRRIGLVFIITSKTYWSSPPNEIFALRFDVINESGFLVDSGTNDTTKDMMFEFYQNVICERHFG